MHDHMNKSDQKSFHIHRDAARNIIKQVSESQHVRLVEEDRRGYFEILHHWVARL